VFKSDKEIGTYLPEGSPKRGKQCSPTSIFGCASDGERRYASLVIEGTPLCANGGRYGDYEYRKVGREGIEVAIKIKGSQGNPRREWVNPEYPFTAISSESDVHANHNEAFA